MAKTDTYTLVSSPAKIPTTLVVTDPPPAEIVEGTGFIFAGRLEETGTGAPVAGRTVTVYFDGPPGPGHFDLVTDADGAWALGPVTPVAGTWTWYAEFAGDETYEGCSKVNKKLLVTLSALAALAAGVVVRLGQHRTP